MIKKEDTIAALAARTAERVTADGRAWAAFLTTAARFYRYSFDDRLLIYAQRPDATACASMTAWNEKAGRWVNAGARGIALLRKGAKTGGLDYVFDVADTHETGGARPLGIWALREEHHAVVLDGLNLKFGGLQSGGDFAAQLAGIATHAAAQSEAAYLRDFRRDIDESGSTLAPQTEAEFHTLLTASTQYMLLTRCGLDAAQHLAPNAFDGITQFTEPAALAHLGNASARVSAALLTEIRSIVKSLERAVSPLQNHLQNERKDQHERIELQQERGLSDPESDNGRGASGADRQIRDAAADLPARAPERDVHVDADDGHIGEPPPGDRPAGADMGGSNRVGVGDTKQRERSAESVGPDGVGGRDERLHPTSGGDRPERVGVQLSLFSAVEEQIERITQARAEEHSSALSFAVAFPISREIIDGVLTSGGNRSGSVLRMISRYEKGYPDAENAAFLREEFGEGGKGLRINGAEYAAWFDADGLQIAHGRTVHVPHRIRISWEDAAVNIRELLNAGRFAAPDTLSAAAENERRELAEKLWYLRHDSSDEAREQGFLPTVGALHNGFPDGTAQLAKMLTDPEKRDSMIDEVQAFADAFAEDRELLRFKHHMPQRLANRLADLRRTPIKFTAQNDFKPSGSPYMSRDEVDAKLIGGNNVQDANYNTYSFFMQGHTPKECAAFLKERYGTGGSLDGIYDSNHSSKGLDFCRRDAELPGDKIVMNWNAVAKRTDELIREGRYLTRAQLDYLPTYERYVLAHDIFFFYRDQPLAITRPFQPTKDYYAVENTIQPLLDDPARMAEIRDSMAQVLVVTAPDNRRYEGMRKTFADVTAFQNGTYSLFTPLSVEQRQTLPAKPDSLTAAARALTRKKPAAKNAESGQLTFAEDAPSTKPVPAVTESAEIAPPIDEPDLTPNVPEYLNLKVQYPAHLIGVEVGENVLFYGKDAETAAPLLGANLLTREIPGLGETFVTGGSLGWRSDLTHLLHAGHSAVFAREDCNAEAGAPYEIIKERSAADYLPIGMKLEIEGRSFEIDSIDYNVGEVSLRDITFQNGAGFPVFRSESVAFVRSFVEEQQDKPPRLEQPPATVAATRRDFRITDGQLGAGGAKAKYRMNVAAIRTLQTIEAECRLATPEEQETLSRYVGWGGASDAFDSAKEKWSAEYAELQALLTREEYDSARASVLNAHYTSPTVIKAMYEAVERMGFTTGNILEPSCGIGNFFGLLPESMAGAKLYGVELDSITGRLARQLYQSADVTVSGFEKTAFPDSFFDLAIGNIPFGDYKVSDKRYDKQNFLIHDYFFAKTLDQMRSGGVVAFITSKGTMDKQSPEVRRYLAQRADLIGAVRLPCDAFKTNAGTEVTADILFLQKRDRVPKTEPEWVNLGATADGISINNYFVQYPEMVLGTMEMQSGAFGMEATCVPIEGASLAEQLRAALMKLRAPTREFTEADELLRGEKQEKTVVPTSIPADPSVRNFSFTVAGDVLYYRENSRMKLYVTNKTREARIRGMIPIRDCTRGLIDLQMQDAPNEAIASEQARLNRLYDSFAADYGLISDSANKQAFGQDSSYCLLCSLEVLDENGDLERKADMFTKRTIKRPVVVTSVDTASEALAVSIGEKACVDIAYMEQLTGFSFERIASDLHGVIFKNPNGFVDEKLGWETAGEYLSGNVREKLATAIAANEVTRGRFAANVKALEAAQPRALSAAEIDVRIGATWIDAEYYNSFMFELLQTPHNLRGDKIRIRYTAQTGDWNIMGKSADSPDNVRVHATYGTKYRNAYALLEDSLNLRDARIFDYKTNADGKEIRVINGKATAIAQQKQEAIGEAFQNWIWKDPTRREVLCKKYNEIFNAIRPREYDGSHINYVGMNPEIHMQPHQSNAVAHILYGGNTLLAHCVGAGKTFEMVAAAMESKRLGLCRKSLVVVPNHLTEQWGGDFLQLYPGANVLVATKKDFEPANRKKFCSRIATGDYDAVVIGHTQFEKIPLSPPRLEKLLRDELEQIIDAIQDAKENDGERYTIKQLEKSKKNIEVRLEKLNDQDRKDDVVTFEELGVDRLFVDEAHGFKNLFLHTKMRNVAGIGQSEAKKSSDMYGKCRYMDELTAGSLYGGGRGVTFATGTPISNSMVELYTMMRYLQFDTLQAQGLGHFDSWAAEYGEKVTAIELSPEGTGFRAKTRFAKFFNLPELMSTWKEAADIQTADMLKLPIPEAEQITVVTKPSEHQRAMVQELAKRAKDVRDRLVEPNVDNMLKITGDGRKLALDQRLQNTLLPDDMGSKVNICTGNIYDIWRDTADQKCAQLVFCDLSTPHYNGKFNVYDDLKSKLIEKGVPANEIVFIHDANTEIRKAELFAKVRSGSVRVLIGSTAKLGAGTNVQTRLIALHHLDCPWRPSDIEQREGRILRQKNENASVKIFKYVTEGTFDAYNWAIIENKQKFIGQIMTGKLPARSCEDVDATALSYAEVKALATGDPRIKQKMDLDIQVAKLKMLKAGHSGQQYETEDKVIEYFPQEIRKTEEQIVGLVADARVLLTHPQKEKDFSMTVAGAVYTERKDAGQALIALCNGMTDPDQRLAAGEYRGFPLMLFIEDRQFRVTAKQALSYTAELADDAVGNVLRIGNALESIPTRLTAQRKRLETLHAELESAKEEALRPFPKDAELTEKSALLAHLNIELDMENNKTEGDEEMTVVVLEPGKEAYTKRFRGELKDMSALVGGEIEPLYPFSDGAVLICNSRGKADGLAPNRYIEGELIAGTCFICGETEDDYTSLDRGQLDAYCKRFRLAEDFSFLAEPGKDGDYTEPVNR